MYPTNLQAETKWSLRVGHLTPVFPAGCSGGDVMILQGPLQPLTIYESPMPAYSLTSPERGWLEEGDSSSAEA